MYIFKWVFHSCSWNGLLCSLSQEVSSASWDQCYLGNADSCIVRVHWWEDGRILQEDSFSFHSSFAHSGSELGWAVLLPTGIWIFWLDKERKEVWGHLAQGKHLTGGTLRSFSSSLLSPSQAHQPTPFYCDSETEHALWCLNPGQNTCKPIWCFPTQHPVSLLPRWIHSL